MRNEVLSVFLGMAAYTLPHASYVDCFPITTRSMSTTMLPSPSFTRASSAIAAVL